MMVMLVLLVTCVYALWEWVSAPTGQRARWSLMCGRRGTFPTHASAGWKGSTRDCTV